MATRRRLDDYAKNQRRIRSLQPKVSSEEAHEQARQALVKAANQSEPTNAPPSPRSSSARASSSSAGRAKTGGSSTGASKNAS